MTPIVSLCLNEPDAERVKSWLTYCGLKVTRRLRPVRQLCCKCANDKGGSENSICRIGITNQETTIADEIYISRSEISVSRVCVEIGARRRDQTGDTLVGVLIKSARMKEFAERGLFTLYLPSSETQEPPSDATRESALEELSFVGRDTNILCNDTMIVPLFLEELVSPEILRKLDGILFKASDFLVNERVEFSQGFVRVFEEMQNLPNVCCIDKIKDIEKILKRTKFHLLLPTSSGVCLMPKQAEAANEMTAVEWDHFLRSAGMKVPVIVKSTIACGLSGSHRMAIAHTLRGLTKIELEYPLCIQQYEPHGNTLYKVYVAGRHVFIDRAQSVEYNPEGNSAGIVHFDASKVKGSVRDDEQINKFKIDNNKILATARKLRESSGLLIFGFDIIVQERTGECLVIDINHFPSMKRVARSIDALKETVAIAVREFKHRSTSK